MKSSISHLNKNLFIALATSFALQACGIEVGNPGKPVSQTPSYTPGTAATEESKVEFAQLVARQHDEALLAAIETYGDETLASALSLKASGKQDCLELGDELSLSRNESATNTLNVGRGTSARIVNETYARSYKAQLAIETSTDGNRGKGKKLIQCRGPEQGIIFDWTTILSVKVDSESQRTSTRQIVDPSDSSVLGRSSLTATGKRQSSLEKQELAATGLKLQRSVSFQSTLSIEENGGAAETSQVATVDKLVIKEVYDEKAQLSSLVLSSGSVASIRSTGEKLILRYQDLALGTAEVCNPTSGTVMGEIYPSADASEATDSFQLIFSAIDSIIRYADGSEKSIDPETCALGSLSTAP